jgi:hypothetical protein
MTHEVHHIAPCKGNTVKSTMCRRLHVVCVCVRARARSHTHTHTHTHTHKKSVYKIFTIISPPETEAWSLHFVQVCTAEVDLSHLESRAICLQKLPGQSRLTKLSIPQSAGSVNWYLQCWEGKHAAS